MTPGGRNLGGRTKGSHTLLLGPGKQWSGEGPALEVTAPGQEKGDSALPSQPALLNPARAAAPQGAHPHRAPPHHLPARARAPIGLPFAVLVAVFYTIPRTSFRRQGLASPLHCLPRHLSPPLPSPTRQAPLWAKAALSQGLLLANLSGYHPLLPDMPGPGSRPHTSHDDLTQTTVTPARREGGRQAVLGANRKPAESWA